MVLHEGQIAEMATGEGKTLVATLPVYLNAIRGSTGATNGGLGPTAVGSGGGVHVVTVSKPGYMGARSHYRLYAGEEYFG